MQKGYTNYNTTLTGQNAEQLAALRLSKQGYNILARNYRASRSEIDIIADYMGTIVFVEVKMRKSSAFGYPEQSVTAKKEEMVRRGAEAWMYENNWNGMIRFDIVAIEGEGLSPVFTHFEDAF
ncbi:MAG: YraN family protein [Bacteroidota bacterium]